MKQANLGQISILVMELLSVSLVAFNGGEMEATATSPPEDMAVVEPPETEFTAPAEVETPGETEVAARRSWARCLGCGRQVGG